MLSDYKTAAQEVLANMLGMGIIFSWGNGDGIDFILGYAYAFVSAWENADTAYFKKDMHAKSVTIRSTTLVCLPV